MNIFYTMIPNMTIKFDFGEKPKQNKKTKQNKTKQNKTKQNKPLFQPVVCTRYWWEESLYMTWILDGVLFWRKHITFLHLATNEGSNYRLFNLSKCLNVEKLLDWKKVKNFTRRPTMLEKCLETFKRIYGKMASPTSRAMLRRANSFSISPKYRNIEWWGRGKGKSVSWSSNFRLIPNIEHFDPHKRDWPWFFAGQENPLIIFRSKEI